MCYVLFTNNFNTLLASQMDDRTKSFSAQYTQDDHSRTMLTGSQQKLNGQFYDSVTGTMSNSDLAQTTIHGASSFELGKINDGFSKTAAHVTSTSSQDNLGYSQGKFFIAATI